MRWDDFRRSDNVEDSRGEDGGFGGGGGIGIPVGGGGLGIGTIVVLGLIGWALGIDPSILIGGAEMVNSGRHYQQPYEPSQPRQAGAPKGQDGRLRRCGSRQYRGYLDRNLQKWRAAVSRAAIAAVLRSNPGRLRIRTIGNGPVLLPERPAHLSRYLFLPRHAGSFPRLQRQGVRICGSLCDRARGRAITCRTCSASCRRRNQRNARSEIARKQIASRCGSNCRLTASPVSGRIIPISVGTRLSRATWKRHCRPQRRSATTDCSSSRAVMSCPMPLRTAHRRSGSAGSRSV